MLDTGNHTAHSTDQPPQQQRTPTRTTAVCTQYNARCNGAGIPVHPMAEDDGCCDVRGSRTQPIPRRSQTQIGASEAVGGTSGGTSGGTAVAVATGSCETNGRTPSDASDTCQAVSQRGTNKGKRCHAASNPRGSGQSGGYRVQQQTGAERTTAYSDGDGEVGGRGLRQGEQ